MFPWWFKSPSPAFSTFTSRPRERFPLKNHFVFKELSLSFSLTPRHQIFCGLSPPEAQLCLFGTTHALSFRSHGICACWSPHPTSTPRISADMLVSDISVTFLATIFWQGIVLQSISCPCPLLPHCLVNSAPSESSCQAVNSQTPDLASIFKQLLPSRTYSSHSFPLPSDSKLAKCVFSEFTGCDFL